jgi:hypothetical protein
MAGLSPHNIPANSAGPAFGELQVTQPRFGDGGPEAPIRGSLEGGQTVRRPAA